MPPPDRIAALLAQDIAAITRQLIGGGSTQRWERAMLEAISRGHAAAAIAGTAERLGVRAGGRLLNERNLSRAERQSIRQAIAQQLPYLQGFAADLGQLSDAQIAARAALYAGATRATYSKGRWEGKGLPDHPASGNTACLVNCKCSWAERDGAMYWELGAAEHCGDCESRASQWRPWRDG